MSKSVVVSLYKRVDSKETNSHVSCNFPHLFLQIFTIDMIQRRFDRQSKGCASQCYITFGTHSFKCAGARIGSRFNARMRMRGKMRRFGKDVQG